jgi:hypothetical protein
MDQLKQNIIHYFGYCILQIIIPQILKTKIILRTPASSLSSSKITITIQREQQMENNYFSRNIFIDYSFLTRLQQRCNFTKELSN